LSRSRSRLDEASRSRVEDVDEVVEVEELRLYGWERVLALFAEEVLSVVLAYFGR